MGLMYSVSRDETMFWFATIAAALPGGPAVDGKAESMSSGRVGSPLMSPVECSAIRSSSSTDPGPDGPETSRCGGTAIPDH